MTEATPFAEVLTVPLPRIGALLPFLHAGADPAVQAARPDGDARHMSDEPAPHRGRPVTAAGPAGSCGATGCGSPPSPSRCLAVAVLRLDARGRHSGFVRRHAERDRHDGDLRAQSYNMQMGQAGLLSFGHAVFFGLGGYCTAHALNAVKAGGFWLPIELVPLVGGLGGLVFGIVFGYIATKQRATAFAMITLGLGELVAACALMFMGFFGGEGGISTDRVIGHQPVRRQLQLVHGRSTAWSSPGRSSPPC